jgi:hypothetical protein
MGGRGTEIHEQNLFTYAKEQDTDIQVRHDCVPSEMK